MNDKQPDSQYPDSDDLLKHIKSEEFKEMKEEYPVILVDVDKED